MARDSLYFGWCASFEDVKGVIGFDRKFHTSWNINPIKLADVIALVSNLYITPSVQNKKGCFSPLVHCREIGDFIIKDYSSGGDILKVTVLWCDGDVPSLF